MSIPLLVQRRVLAILLQNSRVRFGHAAAHPSHANAESQFPRAGGWLEGGAAGNLQLTMPTAFTVAMLSWGLLAFPEGYTKAGATTETLSGIKWGADWLVQTMGEGANGTSNSTSIVYQMGNWTTDQLVSPYRLTKFCMQASILECLMACPCAQQSLAELLR